MSITGTLIVQLIVFLILVGFTMKFVWPPIAAALDARAKKSLTALLPPTKPNPNSPSPTSAWKKNWRKSRNEAAVRLAEAERRAQALIEEAKARATEEGTKIIAAAKVEAEQQAVKAREALREQVAALDVKGAEQILRKEVNAGVHADLLGRLKMDEFGGTSGVVTLEDVLSELLGDVGDEFKAGGSVGRDRCPTGAFRLAGRHGGATMRPSLLRRTWDTDATTVGGMVTAALGHLPVLGRDASRSAHYRVRRWSAWPTAPSSRLASRR